MILITSGAFISNEMTSELGKIPPSFLPIQNKRLFEYQIDMLAQLYDDQIYISVPLKYDIDECDRSILNNKGIEIIYVDHEFSLGQSIYYAVRTVGLGYDCPLSILHGDTLILDLPKYQSNDVALLSKTADYYDWANITYNDDNYVYTGFFTFKEGGLFLSLLNDSKCDFIKAINIYFQNRKQPYTVTKSWLDFGHVNTYFRSKANMTNVRHFNNMSIGPTAVNKSSNTKLHKINAEAWWYSNLPSELRCYVPQLLKWDDTTGYSLEYLYLLGLNELHVFAELEHYQWREIFKSCKRFLNESKNYRPTNFDEYLNNDIYLKKTITRLNQFNNQCESNYCIKKLSYNGVSLGSLYDIATHSYSFINEAEESDIRLIHGDFCFSNILFDFRKLDIKVIDPRGLNLNDEFCLFGDQRYDIAKLAHSVIGFYDLIIANRYSLELNGSNYCLKFQNIEKYDLISKIFFEEIGVNKQGVKELYAIMVQLFLSMIPLHNDAPNRQQAFIANALRLYSKLIAL